MKKYIIITIIILIIGLAVIYNFGFYTYFTEVVVNETALPASNTQSSVSGTFTEIDLIHKGSGTATIIQDRQMRTLRLGDNFQVTNGPDLYVYLSKSETIKDLASLGDYKNIGRLKGNIGGQNYDISTIDPNYKTVVIWCQKYGVLFSYAILR